MMKQLSLALALFLTSLLTLATEAPIRLQLVCEEWKGFTNKDGSGLYWDILRAVYKKHNIQLNLKTVPWKRATSLVLQNQRDAVVGEYFLESANYRYPNLHLAIEDPVVALFEPIIKDDGILHMDNKQVGWIRGYDFIEHLNTHVNYVEFNDIKQGIKLLKVGRIDLLLDYEQSIKLIAEKEGFDISEFEFTPVLPGKKLFLAFANRDRSQQFIEIFEQEMWHLYISGKLAELYEKWGQTQKYQWYQQSLEDLKASTY